MTKRPASEDAHIEPAPKRQHTYSDKDVFVYVHPDASVILVVDVALLSTTEIDELLAMSRNSLSDFEPETAAGKVMVAFRWTEDKRSEDPEWLHSYSMYENPIDMNEKHVVKIMIVWE